MPDASYQQTNFLAGEWSPFFQGRSDHPKYRSAMNLCYNGFPIEEGAWVRRPGTRMLAPTFKGQAAKLRDIFFENNKPYTMEFTDSALRFFNNAWPVITEEVNFVGAISTADPAEVTLVAPVEWAIDDEITFLFNNELAAGSLGWLLRQRTFLIKTIVAEEYDAWSSTVTYGSGSIVTLDDILYVGLQPGNINQSPDAAPTFWREVGPATGVSRKFTIKDSISGDDIDGSTLGDIPAAPAMTCLRILRLTTPYDDGSWANARVVQNDDIALVMNGTVKPQVLQITPNLGSTQAANADIRDAIFHDGPYLDPVKGSRATVSGLSGTVTCTINFASWDSTKTYAIGDYAVSGSSAYKSNSDGNLNNDPTADEVNWTAVDPGVAVTGPDNPIVTGFASTDVGRLMRFFSTPAAWNDGNNYVTGADVYYENLAYKAVADNSDVQPDTDPTKWAVNPSGLRWTWGKITAVTNSNTVSVQILGEPLLYSGEVVQTWRLGVYSDTSGYPTCGIFYKGRFWLGGAVPNRFDASAISDEHGDPGISKQGVLLFSPTLPDGTVTDASGISYKFLAKDKNPIFWFELDQRGIVAGTAGGEWLISAGTQGGTITPTSIDAERVTKYRCADIEPKKTPVSLVFVQSFKRRVMEFIADVFTGRFVAPHLSEAAKHLTQAGVEELGYQEELTPILWARTAAGKLIGAVYRRTGMNAADTPQIVGWHSHELGTARELESMTVGPNGDGSLDALTFVSNDATQATEDMIRWVEQITTLYDADDVIFDAWFLDGALVPDNMYEDTVEAVVGQRLTGLWYLRGKTLTAFVAGLDLGDYTVDASGTMFIPYGTGVDPGKYDYTVAGAGLWKFTAAWVQEVNDMNLQLRNGGIATGGGSIIETTEIITNPNTTSKVQSLLPVGALQNTQSQGVDWANGRLALVLSGNDGFSIMNMTTGAEIATDDMDGITGGSGDTVGSNLTVDPQGGLYCGIGSSNWSPLVKIDTADLSLIYKVGVGSSLTGPPENNAVPGLGRLLTARANANWLLATSGGNINFYKGADGLFISGNGLDDPGYQGVGGVPWTIEEQSTIGSARGAATFQGNVASFYAVACNITDGDQMGLYFIGCADGVPTEPSNDPDDGSLGKKGKGKKGFEEGGVIHTPSINNPLTYFAKILTITPQTVDARWERFSTATGCVVNHLDNSIITMVVRTNQGYSAWSAGTFDTGDKVTDTIGIDTVAFIANKDGVTSRPNTSYDTDDAPDASKDWRLVPDTYITCWTTGQYGRTNAGAKGLKWKVLIDRATNGTSLMQQGRVLGGLFGFLGSHYPSPDTDTCPIYLIDTATGEYFVGDVPGIDIGSSLEQAWDDQSQSLIFQGDYDTGVTGCPTALNSTTDFTEKWCRLYIGNLTKSTHIVSTRTQQPNGYTLIETDFGGGNFPAIVGKTYDSKGQILRPIAPDQSGARTGPAFGKKRRTAKYVALLHQTLGILFGTKFTTKGMIAPALADEDSNIKTPPTEPFSGMWKDSLEDGYGFDSMIGWQIKRPYPATVVSVGGFVETTDA